MNRSGTVRRVVRIVIVALLAFTAVFNIAGGIGTACVALDATRFGPTMSVLAPYQWLYRAFSVLGLLTGVWEAAATVALLRRRFTVGAWRGAIWSLLGGAVVAGAHTVASQLIRGASAPANMRLALTALVLLIMWALDPWVAEGAGGSSETADEHEADEGGTAVTTSAGFITAGVVLVGMERMVRNTHLLAGTDYSSAFRALLVPVGVALIIAGTAILAMRVLVRVSSRRPRETQ